MRAAMVGSGVVLVAVLAIVVVSVTGHGVPSVPNSLGSMRPAPATVAEAISRVPRVAFTAAGSDVTPSGPYARSISTLVRQPAISSAGKPLVDYVGSNWCPYCAATRWPLAVALARFGSFTGLKITTSGRGAGEDYPGTSTLSFYRVGYSSPYLSFLGTEQCSNVLARDSSSAAVMDCGGYEPLEDLPGIAARSFYKYDFQPYQTAHDAGGIPFIDFGNRYLENGAFLSPAILSGMSQAQIAQSLRNPSASPGQVILAGANFYSAIICDLTNERPESVCKMPVVRRAAATLKL
jgi:hypothetical protein